MNTFRSSTSNARGAFTLVEMLVSIAVLSIMMVGVVQIMNGAMTASTAGGKRMDADTQARMVLDRIAYDISKIVKRSDVEYYLEKNPATSDENPNGSADSNDQMIFFSESGGYFPNTVNTNQEGTASLVGYRINSQTAQLE